MLKKPNRAIAFVLAAALGVITVSQAGDTGRLTSNSAGGQTATPSAPPIKTGACSGNTVQDYNVNVGDRTSSIASSCVTPVTQLPNQCADQGVSWGVGNVCAATAPTVSSGSTTRVVNATANYTGQADFLCQNGTYQVTGSPTCNYVPQSCNTQAVTWGANGCSGSSGAVLAHGSTRTISNTAANRSGSTMVSCNNGTISTTTPTTCNLTNQACTAANVSWGSACSGDIAGFPHNSSLTINNTAAGKVGSATFSCNNGSKQYQSGTCNDPAPTTCSSQQVTWGGGCKATVPTMQDGVIRNITNSDYGFVESSGGPSTATCSGGIVSVAANTTCTARPDGSYCPPRTLNWGGVCTAQSPFMLKDNADTYGFPPQLENENPNAAGSTYALCKTGFAQPDLANSTCTAFDSTFRLNLQVTPDPVPANSTITVQWSTVGAVSCAVYVVQDGSVTYSNTTAPANGTISTAIAEPGVAKVSLACKKASDPSGPYSSVVKNLTIVASGSKCQAQAVSWGMGCGTTVASMSNGQSQAVSNFNVGYNGSATLTCKSAAIEVSNPVCTVRPMCREQTITWKKGANQCSFTTARPYDVGEDGGNATDGSDPFTSGYVRFTCESSGTLKPDLANSTCNAVPPQVICPTNGSLRYNWCTGTQHATAYTGKPPSTPATQNGSETGTNFKYNALAKRSGFNTANWQSCGTNGTECRFRNSAPYPAYPTSSWVCEMTVPVNPNYLFNSGNQFYSIFDNQFFETRYSDGNVGSRSDRSAHALAQCRPKPGATVDSQNRIEGEWWFAKNPLATTSEPYGDPGVAGWGSGGSATPSTMLCPGHSADYLQYPNAPNFVCLHAQEHKAEFLPN